MNRHFETKYGNINYIRQYNSTKRINAQCVTKNWYAASKVSYYDNSLRTVMLIILILLMEL